MIIIEPLFSSLKDNIELFKHKEEVENTIFT
jgi:hypothetical protein